MARNLVRFDPFAELSALQKQLFSDDLFRGKRAPAFPTTDVYTEDDKQLTVEIHLPNFDNNDISVSVDQGALVIQAEKHEKEEDKSKRYVVRESSSSMYRRIALPEQADEGHVSANFDNGVLKVVVPFTTQPSARTISVESAKAGAPAVEPAQAAPAQAEQKKPAPASRKAKK